MSCEQFGIRLRDLRHARGLTQRELASRVGLDFTYISKMERNRLEDLPSAEAITRLATCLQTETSELLALAGKVPPGLRPLLQDNPLLVELVRVLSERVLPPETYQELIALAHNSEGDSAETAESLGYT